LEDSFLQDVRIFPRSIEMKEKRKYKKSEYSTELYYVSLPFDTVNMENKNILAAAIREFQTEHLPKLEKNAVILYSVKSFNTVPSLILNYCLTYIIPDVE
jgi:hypothetical protein